MLALAMVLAGLLWWVWIRMLGLIAACCRCVLLTPIGANHDGEMPKTLAGVARAGV